MFEQHHQPLLSRHRFTKRMFFFVLMAVSLDLFAVLTGALGYHWFEGLDWLDSCVSAGLIITGNGPLRPLATTGGKLFALFDALFGGIIFVAVVAVLLTPVFHRVLHKFHLDVNKDGKQ
jgi:hypothetical protein